MSEITFSKWTIHLNSLYVTEGVNKSSMSELQDETHGYMVKTTPSANKTTLLLKLFQGLISSSREIRAPFLTYSGNTKSFFHVPGTKLLPAYDWASCIVLHRIGVRTTQARSHFPKASENGIGPTSVLEEMAYWTEIKAVVLQDGYWEGGWACGVAVMRTLWFKDWQDRLRPLIHVMNRCNAASADSQTQLINRCLEWL